MSIRRLIPNLFTAGNLVCGIIAIILILENNMHIAPWFILAGAVFDLFDGLLARLLKVPSEMGKQLDSLADMVTFGVAPGLILFQLLKAFYISKSWMEMGMTEWNHFPIRTEGICEYMDLSPVPDGSVCLNPLFFYVPYIALLFPVAALFRLAKFNIDTEQTSVFKGLPTPAATIVVASLPILILLGFKADTGWQNDLAHNLLLNDVFLIGLTVILSILMVSRIELFALKFKNFSWKGNELRYIFLTISAILLATLFWWALPIIVVLYIILSLIKNMTSKSEKDEIQS